MTWLNFERSHTYPWAIDFTASTQSGLAAQRFTQSAAARCVDRIGRQQLERDNGMAPLISSG